MKIPFVYFSNEQNLEKYAQKFAEVNTKDVDKANAHAKNTKSLW